MKNAHVEVERNLSTVAMEKFEYFEDWKRANFPELPYYTKLLYIGSKLNYYHSKFTKTIYYVISSNPVIIYDKQYKKAYSYNEGNWSIFDKDLIDD